MQRLKPALQLCSGLVCETTPYPLPLPQNQPPVPPICPSGGFAHCYRLAAPAAESDDAYESLTLGQKIMSVSAAVLFKPGFAVQVRAPFPFFRGCAVLRPLLTVVDCSHQPLPTTTIGALLHPSGLQGISPVPNASDANDANCCAALRVILACFCETLYYDSHSGAEQGRHNPQSNKWLQWARNSGFGTLSRPLFAALLNVALGEQSAAFSEGSWLPYSHLLTSAQGRDVYVGVALHVLLLLLDSSEKGGVDRETNAFWLELASLEDYPAVAATPLHGEEQELTLRPPGNFAKILRGFEALLGQPAVATNSILPASVQAIRCTDELLVLLWDMLCGNSGFRACVQCPSPKIDCTLFLADRPSSSGLTRTKILCLDQVCLYSRAACGRHSLSTPHLRTARPRAAGVAPRVCFHPAAFVRRATPRREYEQAYRCCRTGAYNAW